MTDYPRLLTASGDEIAVRKWLACDRTSKRVGGRQFASLVIAFADVPAPLTAGFILEFSDGQRHQFLPEKYGDLRGDALHLQGHINPAS